MKFKYRPVDMDFLERAPVRFVNEVELDASATDVFTIFEDAEAWPEWIKLIVKVEWTSPKPYGVGTTRIVKGSFLTVNEYFFVWQQNKRFAFILRKRVYLCSRLLPKTIAWRILGTIAVNSSILSA